MQKLKKKCQPSYFDRYKNTERVSFSAFSFKMLSSFHAASWDIIPRLPPMTSKCLHVTTMCKLLFQLPYFYKAIFKARNMEYGIWNTEYGILNTEYGIRNTEYGIRNME